MDEGSGVRAVCNPRLVYDSPHSLKTAVTVSGCNPPLLPVALSFRAQPPFALLFYASQIDNKDNHPRFEITPERVHMPC